MKTTAKASKKAIKAQAADISEVRAVFDRAVADAADPDTRAKRELLREYFTNPEFKTKLAQFMWDYANERATR